MKVITNMCYLAIVLLFFGCMDADLGSGDMGQDGIGGSTARFAIRGNHLFTVDHSNLRVLDISDTHRPVNVNNIMVGFGIETIFPKGQTLFLGSQLGVYIYDISNPEWPIKLSEIQHVFSCDPVVADDNYAYVTLRSIDNVCGQNVNQLDIIDIRDLSNPRLVKSYPMTFPFGLGIDEDLLFVCDQGLKVFDATNPLDLKQLHFFDIPANDVIPFQNVLMVVADDGFYQYRYENGKVELLSKVEIVPVI